MDPVPPAGRAGAVVLGCHGTGAMAVVAGLVARVLDGHLGAVPRLLARELDLNDDVRAGRGVVRGGAAAALGTKAAHASHATKREAEATESGIPALVPSGIAAGRRGARRAKGVARAHGIVAGALLLVGEHRVGLGDFLEALLGVGLLIDIGMQLAGFLLEGLLDVLGGRVLVDAQNGVVVFIVHSCHMAKTPLFMGCVEWETLYPDPQFEPCVKRGRVQFTHGARR